ncbi:putative nuclease HARBI1 [Ischnura elegans]|uniref:putative nuclease HARBI1 n=1 Tax=Ischnura elegans TaxID=197161 RepID=UPI001ED87B2B|nr:putative nuclease HARBI1 [Ischnura elegans]
MLQVMGKLMPEVIALPAEEELERIGEEFSAKAGSRAFRRCVGAIDGTHVRVFCPRGKGEDYINRKLSYSLRMQAVCIASGKIIHAYTGFPGSVHDSRVLRHSSIYAESRYPPEGYFLVGDGGYPCRASPIALITPYRAPSNDSQTLFNHKLSKARIVVERVFGMLKTRWRSVFTKVIEVKIAKAVKVIIACAVMHNVCLTAGDVLNVADNVPPMERQQNPGVEVEEPGENIRGALLELMEIEQM